MCPPLSVILPSSISAGSGLGTGGGCVAGFTAAAVVVLFVTDAGSGVGVAVGDGSGVGAAAGSAGPFCARVKDLGACDGLEVMSLRLSWPLALRIMRA